jgi:glycosyltransferase involved in cell wall biosynthesis
VKVLVLDQFSELGGAQACLLTGLEAMRARGWQVTVGAPGKGPLFCRVRELGGAAFRINCGPLSLGKKSFADAARFLVQTPHLAREVRGYAERFRPDLVYVNGPRLLPAVALAGLRAPVLFHAHSYLPPGMPRTLAGEALCRLQAFVVACCRFVAEIWKPFAPAGRLSVIYNGVAGPLEHGPTRDFSHPKIGCIGRISPEKGQLEFVATAAAIHRARPEARFAIYGAPMFSPDAERYHDQVRTTDVSLPIEFPGWVPNVYRALSQLDLLLVPSAPTEATTRVIPEAFAAGVPVIAFASGGIPEIIEHGRTGFLVKSVKEMAETAMAFLWGDPDRRCSIIRAAREEWQARFTTERYQSQLLEAADTAMLSWSWPPATYRTRVDRPAPG